jgi:hypothetical protein
MAKLHDLLKNFYEKCTITEKILSTPILYKKAKTGTIRIWTGHVLIVDSKKIVDEEDWLVHIKKLEIDYFIRSFLLLPLQLAVVVFLLQHLYL